jgi:hypothetical protein
MKEQRKAVLGSQKQRIEEGKVKIQEEALEHT